MRLIDADEAIARIDAKLNEVPTFTESEYGIVGYRNACIAFKRMLDSLPTVNEWIPVSERLPGIDYINEYILIAVDDDVIPVMVLDGLNWGRGVWGFKDSDDPLEDKITFSFYPWDEISAWQPLPKPYEVGEE